MFSDYFHPELGGIQDSIATTGQALARRGHELDIHVPRYATRDYRRVGLEPREIGLGSGVTIQRHGSLRAPSSTQQSRAVAPSPLAMLRLFRQTRPDIIHAHSFLGLGLEAVLAGTLLRIPVVGTGHTAIQAFAPYLPIKASWAADYVAWFHNRCDFVTAPSRSVLDELGLARLRRPHRIISNPIDTAIFRPAPPDERARLKAELKLSAATITYAGRLGPEKNVDVLVRAVAILRSKHPAVTLAIAGHGSHEACLRRLAMQLGIDRQVAFLGTLPKERLAGLLQASEVFAMMSTSETQSMALLQAMACGTPVVAANSRALPEFVTPKNGFLLAPDDPHALARQLSVLLDLESYRVEIGAGGPPSVQAYGIERVADEWEALYHSLAKRGVAPWPGRSGSPRSASC